MGRLEVTAARRLVAFSEALADRIAKVAHADDQEALFGLMDEYHDALEPMTVTPDGALQGLRGALSEEGFGFAADFYELATFTADSALPLARIEAEVPDEEAAQ